MINKINIWLDNKCAFLLEFFSNNDKIYMILIILLILSNKYTIVIFILNTNHY